MWSSAILPILPARPSQTKPSHNWCTANSSGIAANNNVRGSRTLRNVATPIVAITPDAMKLAGAEKHMRFCLSLAGRTFCPTPCPTASRQPTQHPLLARPRCRATPSSPDVAISRCHGQNARALTEKHAVPLRLAIQIRRVAGRDQWLSADNRQRKSIPAFFTDGLNRSCVKPGFVSEKFQTFTNTFDVGILA